MLSGYDPSSIPMRETSHALLHQLLVTWKAPRMSSRMCLSGYGANQGSGLKTTFDHGSFGSVETGHWISDEKEDE